MENQKDVIDTVRSEIGQTLAGIANCRDLEILENSLENISVGQIINVVGDAAAIERGAAVAVAVKFNQQMEFDWFNCKYREISDDNKIWEPVRAELVKGLRGKGHANPAQFVKRVKDHGEGLRHGYVTEEDKQDGAKNRLPFDRLEQELGRLYKYLNNPSNDEVIKADPQYKRIVKANEAITKTLRDDLGIDLNRYSSAD